MSDRTARARIRDAAIASFAAEGFAAANVKDIAADAGVSSALVMHHFDSKDGLRAACDRYVASKIRELKRTAIAAGKREDPFEAIRSASGIEPLMAYLARTLAGNSPEVATLVDELVEDAVGYTQEGIDQGLFKPTENLREQTAILTLWQLGAMVLHDHAKRLLGVDLVNGGPEHRKKWSLVSARILTYGVIDNAYYEETLGQLSADSGLEATRPDPPNRSANV